MIVLAAGAKARQAETGQIASEVAQGLACNSSCRQKTLAGVISPEGG
jgi:hypothetical protein